MLKAGIFVLVLALMITVSAVILLNKEEMIPLFETREGSYIYLVSSETCPHCRAMESYILSKSPGVEVIETKDAALAASVMEHFGLEWNYGVPLLFGVAGDVFAVSGFPTDSQMVDGYFMGHDYELQLCESTGGKKTVSDGRYIFCTLPTGLSLGNSHSVDKLLEICSDNKCKFLPGLE